MQRLSSVPQLLVLATFMGGAAQSAVLVVGTADPDDGNAIPFGNSSGSVYQQVYAASNFSEHILIASIQFFHTQGVIPGDALLTGMYDIKFSTTSVSVDALDLVNFDNNVGPDEQLFFSGSLGGPIGDTLHIAGMPFLYDPAQGNLLLDIRTAYGSFGVATIYLDAMNGTANGVFSRAQDYGFGDAGYGLVTGFEPVPEPSSVWLAITGVSTTLVHLRRRRSNLGR